MCTASLHLESCTVIHIPPSLWIIVLHTFWCIEYACRLYDVLFVLPYSYASLQSCVSTYLRIPPEIVRVVTVVHLTWVWEGSRVTCVSVSHTYGSCTEGKAHVPEMQCVSYCHRTTHISHTQDTGTVYTMTFFLPFDVPCSARFPFPSPGEVLRSEELFLEIEEVNSLLANDAMTLELKLPKHQHHVTVTLV